MYKNAWWLYSMKNIDRQQKFYKLKKNREKMISEQNNQLNKKGINNAQEMNKNKKKIKQQQQNLYNTTKNK